MPGSEPDLPKHLMNSPLVDNMNMQSLPLSVTTIEPLKAAATP